MDIQKKPALLLQLEESKLFIVRRNTKVRAAGIYLTSVGLNDILCLQSHLLSIYKTILFKSVFVCQPVNADRNVRDNRFSVIYEMRAVNRFLYFKNGRTDVSRVANSEFQTKYFNRIVTYKLLYHKLYPRPVQKMLTDQYKEQRLFSGVFDTLSTR